MKNQTQFFRLCGKIVPSSSNIQNSFDTRLLTNSGSAFQIDANGSSITATLGISIEPISVVEEQIAALPLQASSAIPEHTSQITNNILKNLYNYVTSFSTPVPPYGAQIIGTGNSYMSTKTFQDWYDGFMRKVKMDPSIVLKSESDST